MALAVIVMVGMVVAAAGGSCQADDNVLMQMNQDRAGSLATKRFVDPCEVKPFPCSDPAFANFPLQQINLKSPDKVTFNVLDLTTGNYTNICEIPNVELNACGISPKDDAIYCITSATRQFVRVQCDIPPTFKIGDPPVTGQLCFFGPLPGDKGLNAGNFDPFTGDYYAKQGGGVVRKISYTDILTFITFPTEAVAAAVDQLAGSASPVVTEPDLNPLDDFNIAKFSAPGLFGGAEDLYLVGCRANKVFLQSLTTPANFAQITMTNFGAVPAGNSGATWLFAGNTSNPDLYCAYNNGNNGVINVNVTGIFNDGTEDKIPAGFVSSSRGTNSNDGLNCMKVETPFPPAGTAPPTTSTSTTESTESTRTTESTESTRTTESTESTRTTESTESTRTTESTESTRTTESTESTRTTMSMETTRTTETAPDPGSSTTVSSRMTSTTTSTDEPTTTSTDEPTTTTTTTTKKPYGRHRRFRRWFWPFRRHRRDHDQHGYRYS